MDAFAGRLSVPPSGNSGFFSSLKAFRCLDARQMLSLGWLTKHFGRDANTVIMVSGVGRVALGSGAPRIGDLPLVPSRFVPSGEEPTPFQRWLNLFGEDAGPARDCALERLSAKYVLGEPPKPPAPPRVSDFGQGNAAEAAILAKKVVPSATPGGGANPGDDGSNSGKQRQFQGDPPLGARRELAGMPYRLAYSSSQPPLSGFTSTTVLTA